MGEYFSFDRLKATFFPTLSGLNVTLGIMGSSFLLALTLGILLTVIRIKGIPVLDQLSRVYISFTRGAPIIVQLYLVYYGLPFLVETFFGININRWNKIIYVVLALGLNEASFFSEILRGSIQAIARDQMDAAYSIGLTWSQAFRRIIAPQALKIALPALVEELITLLQSTALAYMFAVPDVLGAARDVAGKVNHSLEAYTNAAGIFVVICLALECLSRSLSRSLNGGKEV
jgi:L-cystine transport system permease protein